MCAAMAHLPINKVEAVFIMIMKMFQRMSNLLGRAMDEEPECSRRDVGYK